MTDKNTADLPAAPAAQPPADAPKHEECRNEPRVHVRWHADISVDDQVYSGFVKDISMQGADIFLDHNLQHVKSAKLRIHVPPLNVTIAHHVTEVSGKVIYTSHDSDEQLFRTGIKFLKFDRESDREHLQARLAHR